MNVKLLTEIVERADKDFALALVPADTLTKFAELLIRECMEVTINYPHPQTKLTAAEHIARHFGVE